ncbi:ABC transporter ATP-binding protein [Aquibacillus sediminis]|uniref:ABC transporter ATP-binding protein n=1 Tax=Aquibacillus sediminis TaxID=2574734 RepID=UPI0011089089|nr:ABC transporter ATP-binding protein [Aquibacillus sediminis]
MGNQKVLALKHLTKSFGQKHILQGITLDVYQGEIIGYIGPNGAGKSTTVKIMLGLVDDFEGEVELFGYNIADGDPTYKQRIGYVPEHAEVYDNLTAREYLTFVGELYGMERDHAEEKAKDLMAIFELTDVFDARLSSFSKGMRQKVLIIASLLHNPDLLFLDEPLSGLDASSVMIVKEVLAQLAEQGKTIFYSSHIMDVVEKISNRIVLLHDGQIVADGSFEQLQQQNKEGTLEQIFNELTGFNQHEAIASSFVSVVQDGDTT